MDTLNELLAFARQQMLELGLLLLGSIITIYVVPWLKEKRLSAFADRVDLVFNRAVQAALNKVPGVQAGEAVLSSKVGEVIAEATAIVKASAPELAKTVAGSETDKVLGRIEVRDILYEMDRAGGRAS